MKLLEVGGGNNYPLKGGKTANWEGKSTSISHPCINEFFSIGGIRTNAFVSGGFVPPNVQGTKVEENILLLCPTSNL